MGLIGLLVACAAGCGSGEGSPGDGSFLAPPSVTNTAKPDGTMSVLTGGCKPVVSGVAAVAHGTGPVKADAIIAAAGGHGRPINWSDAYEREFTGAGRLQYCLSINSNIHVRADSLLQLIAPHADVKLLRDLSESSGEDAMPHSQGYYTLKDGSNTATALIWLNGSMQNAIVVEAPGAAQIVRKITNAEVDVDWGE